jgi:hypothetical protein
MTRRYLIALQALQPDYAKVTQNALNGPGGPEVQNVRALLALPYPTVWLRSLNYEETNSYDGNYDFHFHRLDLPLRFSSAGVLNRDLRQWLAYPFSENHPFGAYEPARRARLRGRVYIGQDEAPLVPDDWESDAGLSFLRLIAWDELAQLGVCHGLTNRLSTVLVDWIDTNSDTWVERMLVDTSEYPALLRRVIFLNKRSSGGLIEGRPAGQRAFALLSTRFPDSREAVATKYWYFDDKGCR